MRSMTKGFFSLLLTLMLIAILAATSISTASAAPVKSASSAASHKLTQVTAKNLRQFFPNAHLIQTKVGSSSLDCFLNSIQSYQNSRFVSTEIGYTGDQYAMLRARASVLGPWEQYTMCIDSATNLMTMQANANGLYVSTEIGYSGSSYAMLRARASTVGLWEQYFLNCDYSSICTIQSKANGLFVAEEDWYWGSGYGMLRARTSLQNVGTWEEFLINPA